MSAVPVGFTPSRTQRMAINAALRNATMQTEGLASVVRALVDATEIRIHRARSFVAVWDKERGRFVKLATPVTEAAIDLVREPVEKGGQHSKVIDEVLKKAANAFAGWVQWEVDRITRNSKEDRAAVDVATERRIVPRVYSDRRLAFDPVKGCWSRACVDRRLSSFRSSIK